MSKFEVLSALPPYGEMYVPITPDGTSFYSEGLPVRFHRYDGTSWVGNFRPGFGSLNLVHEFRNSPNLLIVSGGQCYLIDPDTEVVVLVFGGSYEKGIQTADGRLVMHDLTGLTIVEGNANYWHTQDIAIDGIRNLSINGAIISGSAYLGSTAGNDWNEFNYNMDTKELTYHKNTQT